MGSTSSQISSQRIDEVGRRMKSKLYKNKKRKLEQKMKQRRRNNWMRRTNPSNKIQITATN